MSMRVSRWKKQLSSNSCEPKPKDMVPKTISNPKHSSCHYFKMVARDGGLGIQFGVTKSFKLKCSCTLFHSEIEKFPLLDLIIHIAASHILLIRFAHLENKGTGSAA